jgi:hypothetical protein
MEATEDEKKALRGTGENQDQPQENVREKWWRSQIAKVSENMMKKKTQKITAERSNI